MNKELVKWLDNLLDEIEVIKFRRKSARRVRIDVKPEVLPALLSLLQGRASYVHLSAISCVDWIDEGEFELVYHLWSYETNSLVSAHIRIPRESAQYVSMYDLYEPAAFFERDIYEMFGITFEGCPILEKFILTEWDGPPPMRKDFDSEKYVNETFTWEDYRPDWLTDIEEKGGGITTRPEDVR